MLLHVIKTRKEYQKVYDDREILSNPGISCSPASRTVRKRACVVSHLPLPSVLEHFSPPNGAHSWQIVASQAYATLEVVEQVPGCAHSIFGTPIYKRPLKDKR